MNKKEKLRLAALITAGSLAVVGLAAAVCVVASPHQPQEEGEWLTPSRLDLSSVLSSQAAEQEQKADTWPKVPVPERDPNYNPPQPSWLHKDLTEAEPIHGKVAYLTFDDGPSSMTPQVLDVLNKMGATATFFTVHNSSEECKPYYRRIIDSGCELAVHSYTHDYKKIYQSVEAFFEDYNKMNDFLFETAGVRTKQIRFPGGSSQTVTDRGVFWGIMKEVQAEGIVWHDWNVSSGDASPKAHPAEWIYNNIFPEALRHDTPVILMHDIPRNTGTLEALPWIIKTLRANGYRLDCVSNLEQPVQHKNPEKDAPPQESASKPEKPGKPENKPSSSASESPVPSSSVSASSESSPSLVSQEPDVSDKPFSGDSVSSASDSGAEEGGSSSSVPERRPAA